MSSDSPLAGKRVVNTRAVHQAGELDRVLEEHGAIPLAFPCIAIGPPDDLRPLDAALRELAEGRFDWVVFTSVNTVDAVARRYDCHPEQSEGSWRPSITTSAEHRAIPGQVVAVAWEPVKGSPTGTGEPDQVGGGFPSASERLPDLSSGVQPRAMPPAKIAAVGPVTAEAVERRLGWPVAFLPPVETASALGAEMPVSAGDGVLLPKSAIAGPALAAILRTRGADVTEVVAYATGVGSGGVDLASALAAGELDAVCFTSPSTVHGCLQRLGGSADLTGVRIACIGSETAAAARASGLRVDVVPGSPMARAMVEALAAWFATDEKS